MDDTLTPEQMKRAAEQARGGLSDIATHLFANPTLAYASILTPNLILIFRALLQALTNQRTPGRYEVCSVCHEVAYPIILPDGHCTCPNEKCPATLKGEAER